MPLKGGEMTAIVAAADGFYNDADGARCFSGKEND
jgi:hypothetical protein